ncbi:mitochondrial inner membrane protein required for protein import, partial [Irineochytrium annulatum]
MPFRTAHSKPPPDPAPAGETRKQAPKDQPAASDGMDLFSRALAAQRARQEAEHARAQAAASGSSASSSSSTTSRPPPSSSGSSSGFPEDEGSDQPLTPEEEERIRRLKDRARAAEAKTFAFRGKWLGGISLAALVLGYIYLGLPREGEGKDDVKSHHERVMRSLTGGYKEVTGPVGSSVGTKLLPDPLPEGYQKNQTLFLELNDTLMHMTWDKALGWRAATRPGVKQFLSYLSRYYEIVIFTNSHNYIAQPVIEALDPFHYTMYSLYRDSTTLVKGKNVKDLSLVNRDLKRCIIVDPDPKNYQLQPENGITIKRWRLDADDKELYRLMTFLEEIALMSEFAGASTIDVRKLLKLARDQDPEDPMHGWELYKQQLRTSHDDLMLQNINKQRESAKLPPFESLKEAVAPRQPNALTSVLGALF